jgi:hypothetical protein
MVRPVSQSSRALALCLGVTFATAVLAPLPVFAQPKAAPAKPSSTSTLLDRAQSLFDDQHYEESIQTLSGALVRPGNTQDEKNSVLKLLAFNYIAMGNKEAEADAAVRAIYVNQESYELPKGESPRFRDFFKKTKAAWISEGKPGQTSSGTAPPSESTIKITYSPPAQVDPNASVKIEGKIEEDPDARVVSVELAVKSGPNGKFQEKPLVFSMGSFRGEIAPTSVQPPLVEFYILALDKDGLPLASRGDVDAPLRIAVPEPKRSVFVSPAFWIPVTAVVVVGAVLTGVLVATVGKGKPNVTTATIKITVGE